MCKPRGFAFNQDYVRYLEEQLSAANAALRNAEAECEALEEKVKKLSKRNHFIRCHNRILINRIKEFARTLEEVSDGTESF